VGEWLGCVFDVVLCLSRAGLQVRFPHGTSGASSFCFLMLFNSFFGSSSCASTLYFLHLEQIGCLLVARFADCFSQSLCEGSYTMNKIKRTSSLMPLAFDRDR
jgi:hypothetical protein